MKKKQTIGSNPLDAYLQFGASSQEKKESKNLEEKHQIKQRITIHLTVDLIERVKNAVFWQPGMTLTSFAEEALETALKKSEKARGESYPERTRNHLKGGRPLS